MNAKKLRKLHGRRKGECTWCGDAVSPPRKTWCSDACVEAFRQLHDWRFVRNKIYERDRGKCCLCGCDTLRMVHLASMVRYREGFETWVHLREFFHSVHHHGVLQMDQWQVDHIVARCCGGDHSMANLRTVCLECHKSESARLLSELAQSRKEKTKGVCHVGSVTEDRAADRDPAG